MKGLFQCPLPLVGDRNLREEETAPPVALNLFAIRLTDHQKSRRKYYLAALPSILGYTVSGFWAL